jgi:hypothetical protein
VFEGSDCIYLGQDRVQWLLTVNANEPSVSMKDGEFIDYLSVLLISQRALCSLELVC